MADCGKEVYKVLMCYIDFFDLKYYDISCVLVLVKEDTGSNKKGTRQTRQQSAVHDGAEAGRYNAFRPIRQTASSAICCVGCTCNARIEG